MLNAIFIITNQNQMTRFKQLEISNRLKFENHPPGSKLKDPI